MPAAYANTQVGRTRTKLNKEFSTNFPYRHRAGGGNMVKATMVYGMFYETPHLSIMGGCECSAHTVCSVNLANLIIIFM